MEILEINSIFVKRKLKYLLKMELSQKQLQETHNIIYSNGTYGRRFGKTTYWCSVLRGYLDVLNNADIHIFVEKENSIIEFLNHFQDIFGNDLEMNYSRPYRKLFVKGKNVNKVIFHTKYEMLTENFRGFNRDIIPIFDFDEVSSYFYNSLFENYEITMLKFIDSEIIKGKLQKSLENNIYKNFQKTSNLRFL